MSEPTRRPAVFSIDDPRLVAAPPEEAPRAGALAPLSDPRLSELTAAAPPSRRFRWASLLWSAVSGLVLLWLGAAVTNFIEELFARAPWLGAFGLGLAILAGLALTAIVLREILGLTRLGAIEALRARAAATLLSDDRDSGRAVVSDLLTLTKRMPRLARGRSQLEPHLSEIIDGRDLIRIAERELMSPLDSEARRMVMAATKRVSVVTAVSPRAAVDMVFVLVNALGLIRRLAVLYGGRPGALGVFRLLRQVISHLAVTGGVAVTDSLVQQVIGHGVAAKLSARLGEGVLNGLLTARLGLLAIDLTRPLPFGVLPRPTLNELAGSLLRPAGDKGEAMATARAAARAKAAEARDPAD